MFDYFHGFWVSGEVVWFSVCEVLLDDWADGGRVDVLVW